MKVALVYDWVVKWGGAERMLLVLHELWPDAPLYTSVYWPQKAVWAKDFKVIPSFLNKLPLVKTRHEWLAGLMPLAFESWDFADFDLVISVTSAFAKGVITGPKTKHLCFCLTPTRFLWSGYKPYFGNFKPPLGRLRAWDKIAAQRPDKMIAISQTVQKRIKKYYNRDSEIIYPPVETNKFNLQLDNSKIGNYFLVVSRLVKYKKVDLVVRAFNQLGWPLKIIGVGREKKRLQKMADKNVEFLGQLTDKQLLSYYQKCRALIFAQEEDFGLTAVEAQACGRPVIAYQAGGARETVIPGKTGLFFEKQTVADLTAALKKFAGLKFKPTVCRQNALRFDQKKFKKEVTDLIKKWC